ncbi:hypothetical protein G9463_22605 [Haloarcula sp. JP-Z28]|nr:hypothetical protein [Haloarcula sp. JP-Z28]
MVVNDYWLIPHMYWAPDALTPFFQKPPLVMWLQATSMSVFGINTFAARLPIALLTVVLAVVVYRIGRDLYDWRAGVISGLFLLVFPSVYSFGHSGRSGALDVPLVLFGTLFVWWAYRGREDPSLLLPAGAAAALAVLSKGIAAGVFLIILAPIVAIYCQYYINLEALKGAILGTVLILLWPIYAYLQHGDAIIQGLILRQVERSQGGLTTYGDPIFGFMNYPYFDFILSNEYYLLPITIVALFIGWLIYRKGFSSTSSEIFLFWWVISVPITFAVVGGNHGWYILPMVPPLTILIGRVGTEIVTIWNGIFNESDNYLRLSTMKLLLLGVIVTLVIASVYPSGVGAGGAAQQQQQELATAFEHTDSEEVIYIQVGALEPRYYTFAFYVNRPLDSFTMEKANQNSPTYAVVKASTLTDMNRNYVILKQINDATAVRINN